MVMSNFSFLLWMRSLNKTRWVSVEKRLRNEGMNDIIKRHSRLVHNFRIIIYLPAYPFVFFLLALQSCRNTSQSCVCTDVGRCCLPRVLREKQTNLHVEFNVAGKVVVWREKTSSGERVKNPHNTKSSSKIRIASIL